MSMPSMASNFASQPLPVGQMIDTTYPASRSALASCQTRRSNGDGRFSTRIRTRFILISPYGGDELFARKDRKESGKADGVEARAQELVAQHARGMDALRPEEIHPAHREAARDLGQPPGGEGLAER